MCVCVGGSSVPVIDFKLASRRNRVQHICEASKMIVRRIAHFKLDAEV